MIEPSLETQAVLDALHLLTDEESERFRLLLPYHDELRRLCDQLQRIAADWSMAQTPSPVLTPRPELRAVILSAIKDRPQRTSHEAVVIAGADALVRWVSPAFTRMCGYELDELRGKKLGPILQGPATDRAAVARLREAIAARLPCREKLVNYHKNGSPYLVEIALHPVLDDAGQPLFFVARETEQSHRAA